MTQRELALRTHIPQPTVARIEAGSVVPRVDTLQRLLRGCEMSLELGQARGEGVDVEQIRALVRMDDRSRAEVVAASDENLVRARELMRRPS
jgi:predicted transcriptional regulator